MARVVWTRQSREDVAAIKEFIARDAPRTAEAFVERLTARTDRLKLFPFSGSVVPELNRENIREIFCGSYRIIHRASEEIVEVLTVHHGARLLDEDLIPPEA